MNMGILSCKLFKNIRGAVRGMIIHNNNIESEIGFLPQRAVNRVCNRFFTIEHWNDDAGFPLEVILFFVCVFYARRQISR